MLLKLKNKVGPKGKKLAQHLANNVSGLQKADKTKNLNAAIPLLKDGAEVIKEMIPELPNKKYEQLYKNVRTENLKLNKEIKERPNDFKNFKAIRDFIAFKTKALKQDLSE